MKRWNVVAVMFLCLLIGLAGCIPTEEQMLNLGNDVDLLMEKIDDQQSKLIAQIDKVQDHVTIVNEAVKAAKTLPEKAAAGIEASRPFNPYADEMVLGLGLLTAIGGLFLRKSSKEASIVATKYKAHKQGVEQIRAGMTPEDSRVLYDEIGKARAALRV